jgi:hypothetical protein
VTLALRLQLEASGVAGLDVAHQLLRVHKRKSLGLGGQQRGQGASRWVGDELDIRAGRDELQDGMQRHEVEADGAVDPAQLQQALHEVVEPLRSDPRRWRCVRIELTAVL